MLMRRTYRPARTICGVPLRVRISLLAVLAAFWFVLSAVRFSHGQVFVGVLYFLCGGVLTLLARQAATKRR
jgi:hypothetical protein